MSEIKIPNHVGIILDGNGRWATSKGLKRSEGHKAGYENLKKLSIHILNRGVKYLSVYVFSTENFKRSEEEVGYLMNLFITKFKVDAHYFSENNVKVVFSGRKENLRSGVLKAMNYLCDLTKDNTGGILNICLNYGARSEIVDMAKRLIDSNIDPQLIDEELISKNMYNDLPDIDFLIRTSGEMRLSNFMLWQVSYAELYFPTTYFPDFNENEFDKALIEYGNRDRRFGGIIEQK